MLANKTKWSSSVTATKEATDAYKANKRKQEQAEHRAEEAQSIAHGRVAAEAVVKVMYMCGTCSNKVLASRKAFRKDTLDAKTWCGKCAKSLMAKTFKCQCGVPWHKCLHHQPGESQMERVINDAPNIKRRKKSPAEVFRLKTLQEDLEGNNKDSRKRKRKVFEPVFRQSMLSAGLRLRFASLCQNGEV